MTATLTRANTAIVTDSTCDPPERYWSTEGLAIVPLRVHFGDETYLDGVDLKPPDFFAKLATARVLPTTSQPSRSEFAAVYRRLLTEYEHVIAVHITAGMSGTYDASRAAAEEFPHVHVFDSGNVTTSISLLIERIWARLDRGTSVEEIAQLVRRFYSEGRLLIHAATLEYLRRGGRIDRARSMVGDIFGIRPLVEIRNGHIDPYAKVRGARRTLEAMVGHLQRYAPPGVEVHLAFTHATNPEAVPPLREALLAARPDAIVDVEGAVAAVVGTHIGPGAVAYAMFTEP